MVSQKRKKRKNVNIDELEGMDEQYLPELIDRLQRETIRFNQEVLANKIGEFKSKKSATLVTKLLESEDAYVRNAGIEILRKINESCIPILEKRIHDESKDIRKFVLDVLKEIRTEESSKLAIGALEDPDENVQQAAIEVLGEHQYEKAYPLLQKRLKESNNLWIISALIKAMGSLGIPQAKEDILEKVSNMSRHGMERSIAFNAYVRSLEKLGTPIDLRELLFKHRAEYNILDENLLHCIQGIAMAYDKEDFDEETRREVQEILQAQVKFDEEEATLVFLEVAMKLEIDSLLIMIPEVLQKFNYSDTFCELLLEKVMGIQRISKDFVKGLLNNPDDGVKVFALKVIRAKKVEGLQEEILDLCRDNHDDIKKEALEIVAYVDSYWDVNTLESYACDENGPWSEVALQGMVRKGHRNMDVLIHCLRHSNARTRRIAAKELITCKDRSILERILQLVTQLKDLGRMEVVEVVVAMDITEGVLMIREMMESEDPRLRSMAIEMMDKMEETMYYEHIAVMTNDPSDEVRVRVIKSLLHRREEAAYGLLNCLYHHETVLQNKYEILRGLSNGKQEGAFPILLHALDENNLLLRITAIHALGVYGDQRATSFINAYRYDPVPEIREAVEEAIGRLGVLV